MIASLKLLNFKEKNNINISFKKTRYYKNAALWSDSKSPCDDRCRKSNNQTAGLLEPNIRVEGLLTVNFNDSP